MIKAKLIKKEDKQVIEIPKELSFDCDTVYIEKIGDSLVIRADCDKWHNFFEDIEGMESKNFLKSRKENIFKA